jgi:L-2,4-diaminobutyrate decarboxylase
MDPVALGEALSRVAARGEVPVAVVATAGTTDFGSIDPLPQVAEAAREHGAWLHVDAAYGGGALFSDRLAPLLSGLERADSLALDLHKLGWQPVAAGVFLTRDAAALKPLEQRVAYLNPADDEEAGYPSLLGRSLRTTRRADAFKIAVTLRALGRSGLGTLVDRCHDLAGYAGRAIDRHPQLFLEAQPVLASVVFAYWARTDADRVNAALRRRLLAEGRAVIGRTELGHSGPNGLAGGGRVRLKLTFLNPATTPADVDALLEAIVLAGQEEEVR